VNSGSAVPAWLQAILPKWFTDRPAFTEALWAGSVSFVYASAPIFGAIYGVANSQGMGDTLPHFLAFLHNEWFGILMGYVFGGGVAGIRAKQAASKAAAAPPNPTPPALEPEKV